MSKKFLIAETWQLPDGSWVRGPFIEKMAGSRDELALHSDEGSAPEVNYEDLAKRMVEAGVKETNKSLRSKLSRGSFTADFFLQALAAMGANTLKIGD